MKKDFVFTLDPSGQKAFLIRIDEVEREGERLKWKPRRKLYRDELMHACKGLDLEAVNALLDEKMRHSRSLGRRESQETLDLSEVPIEAGRAMHVLKALSATGKLYYERKPVTANFYSNLKIRYLISPDSGGGIQVLGKFKSSTQEFDLGECDFHFCAKPYWVIHKGCLKTVSSEVLGKWMLRLFEDGKFSLSPEEAKEFFEEAGEENIEGERGALSMPDPLPVLFLTDQRGVFANLRMNYAGELVAIDEPAGKGRKIQAEDFWKKDLLEAGYIEKKVGSSQFYCPSDKVGEALQLLLQIGWEVRDAQKNRLLPQTAVDAEASESFGIVNISGKVKFESGEAPLPAVLNALKRNECIISLKEGASGFISKEFFQKNMGALFEGEVMMDKILVKKEEISLLQDLFDSGAKVHLAPGLDEFRKKLCNQEDLPAIALGPGFSGTLRNYQQKGVSWLSFLHQNGLHGILADDMGLGKTVQVLAFLSTIPLARPVLIVMPRSLLFHWKGEIERFFPTLAAVVYHGNARSPSDLEKKGAFAVLTTYSTLRQDVELFQNISFSCAILDEAQAIKNRDTQTSRAVRKIKADFRLSLTGTPIENHPGEILSQFQFLMPGLFSDEEAPLDIPKIRKKARSFILRRKKGEVDEELPEKIEQELWLEMEPAQRGIYDGFLNAVREGLLNKVSLEGGKKSRMEIFEAILRLRQIACHPLLFQDGSDGQAESVKFDQLFLDLETVIEEGQKALVFSQFTTMLKLIARKVQENGWKHCYLDGETKDRERVVRQFQEDPETKLFLISLKAGGVGMNLTAADYVFLYDPWWNAAVEEQAIDRAHRIGRRHPVIAKRYLVRGSIEERMMQLKKSKQTLAKDLFEEGAGTFSADDLEYLLS